MGNKIVYYCLFALLLVFLFTPMVQEHFGIVKTKPLNGVIYETDFPALNLKTFSECSYQSELEKYVSENFGFREPLIRFYNQYVWSLYNKTYNNTLAHGKENWFYYGATYRDYYGYEQHKWFDSTEEAMKSFDKNVDNFVLLRDILKQFDVEFMSFMAPSKAFVYPEYLPDAEPDSTSIRAFEYYDSRFSEVGFPNIEMTKWFKEMRDTIDYPLFPTIDTHWGFSSVYAFDSLFRFMNSLNDFGMPTISYGEPVESSTNMTFDEGLLNLIFPVKNKNKEYDIDVQVKYGENHKKPRVLFIGDSFIWALLNRIPCKEIFEDVEIWYYNSTVHQNFKTKEVKKRDINSLASILKSDYVIFYSSGHQWHRATYKFLDQTLASFGINDSVREFTMNENVKKALIHNDIEKDKQWMDMLEIYSTINKMDINKVLNLETENVYHDRPYIKNSVTYDSEILFKNEVDKIIKNWRSNPESVERLKEKARIKGKDFEEVIVLEAEWFVRTYIMNEKSE